MRDFKGMKRQRGRNRGGGGGKPQQQNANRAFDSNGPDGVKVRGNAQHVFEKYQQLARDASSAGDRVLAENYLQHAEHYFRVVRAMQPTKPAAEILGRDNFSGGLDIDFEDESGAQAAAAEAAEAAANSEGEASEGEGGEQPRAERWDRQRDDRQDRQRDDRNRDRDDRQRGDRFEGRNRDRDRWRDRDDRQRDDRPRDERPRDDRPREERQRDDRPRGERDDRRERFENRRDREDRQERGERQERPERDPLAVVEPQAAPLVASSEDRAAPSPVLRDEDGGESHAPAFLKAPRARKPEAAAAAEGEEKPKTRRRRAPRSFEGGEASNETEEA